MDVLQETIRVLDHLVTFDVVGGESNLPIAGWIEDYLKPTGLEIFQVENPHEQKLSLHCRFGPENDGGIILSGHMDVVPANTGNWNSDPFDLTKSGDRLYGRGTCDMKGFLACCLTTLSQLDTRILKKPVYLALSYDEEVGCLAGRELARQIRKSYRESPACAIIGEPTSMKPVTAEKGIAVFETRITSSAAHSSLIRTEISAIHEAARLILWLEDHMENLIAEGRIDKRFDPPHTSIHCGIVRGGIASNIIADKCSFQWDVRNIPHDEVTGILSKFEGYCATLKSSHKSKKQFEIETFPVFPPVPGLDTAEFSPFVDLVKRLTGNSTVGSVPFASEAGQFSEEGFESIVCGPGSIDQAHRANEFIEIEQLAICLRFLKNLIREYCQ